MQIIKAPAGNTSESGIRAEREGNSFNLILGGNLVYSPAAATFWPLLRSATRFLGLKTKPSLVAFLLMVLSRTVLDSSES